MTAQKPPPFLNLERQSADRRIELPAVTELLALRETGMTDAQIGERYGCSASLVTERIGQSGFTSRRRPAELLPVTRVYSEQAWMERAACRELSVDGFYPEMVNGSTLCITKAAKAVCAGCPVREQCLEYALAGDEREGVWGGTSPRERRNMRVGREQICAVPTCKNPRPKGGPGNSRYCGPECSRAAKRIRNREYDRARSKAS